MKVEVEKRDYTVEHNELTLSRRKKSLGNIFIFPLAVLAYSLFFFPMCCSFCFVLFFNEEIGRLLPFSYFGGS